MANTIVYKPCKATKFCMFEIEYYQIVSITYDPNGISNIEATHFPLNNSNVSEITNEILTGSYTVLQ